MLTKVKECLNCGQGFAEDNTLIGIPIPSPKSPNCINGHIGPINRVPLGKYFYIANFVSLVVAHVSPLYYFFMWSVR